MEQLVARYSLILRCLALLALLASYWGMYQHGRSVEKAEAGQASAQRDSGDRLAEVIGERSARQEEQRRVAAQEEARAHAQEERKIVDADAAGADAAGQRLRSEAAQLAATVSCPGPDTAAIARGQAATRAAMVLSDLLARADERAGDLAKSYDAARTAGRQCEREYDALNPPG
ncbi:DUF2514 domain-containing protein [Pseudomonas monteilii]|uniref:DUF2514 domain-containing protein n=1 Tax=Pseudomonas monteilii TaxID=76759 RepID=UPI001E4C1721|nr:DUF2514 domain-containing protein [Pseudomonas monteilii]MCE0873713.1 DUF2514 domain-containing protein [Pseudomonas monteilii]WJN86056.1 DUF2514 domain-containing protein [Pseudomonas monteilii]WJO30645.1 DUF2514 domain-containing protein [Pseudomonas monteilii]WJO30961.1 DUF2514 domain-containing protein [Pseudomonas monteilii]WMM94692.1 hypothetical protein [Pseudomonas monteilii]